MPKPVNVNLIHNPLLGWFSKTGKKRQPVPGDYYLGPKTNGICLATRDTKIVAEILIPAKKPEAIK